MKIYRKVKLPKENDDSNNQSTLVLRRDKLPRVLSFSAFENSYHSRPSNLNDVRIILRDPRSQPFPVSLETGTSTIIAQ